VKISNLPRKEFRMMENMHRWQKQMNVPLSEVAADNDQYLKEETVGNLAIRWVDIRGLGVHTVSKPADPHATSQDGFLGGLQGKKGKQPFTYTVPNGWNKADAGQFAVDAYEITAGGETARVTVTPLDGPRGRNVAENVNRWRIQVKLERLSAKDAEKETHPVDVGGIKSTYVDISNKDGPPAKNRILAVIVPVSPSTTWTVVMSGPNGLVEQNKKAFDAFVESFKK